MPTDELPVEEVTDEGLIVPPDAGVTHKTPEDHLLLFQDLVDRETQRNDAINPAVGVPPVPPQRVQPPPVINPTGAVFGTPPIEPENVSAPFDMTGGAVLDPSSIIPSGRLLEAPAPNAEELTWEIAVVDELNDALVTLKQDVWEEVFPPGTTTPAHILRFSKGQRVPKTSLVGLKVLAQEESPKRNIQTKEKRRA